MGTVREGVPLIRVKKLPGESYSMSSMSLEEARNIDQALLGALWITLKPPHDIIDMLASREAVDWFVSVFRDAGTVNGSRVLIKKSKGFLAPFVVSDVEEAIIQGWQGVIVRFSVPKGKLIETDKYSSFVMTKDFRDEARPDDKRLVDQLDLSKATKIIDQVKKFDEKLYKELMIKAAKVAGGGLAGLVDVPGKEESRKNTGRSIREAIENLKSFAG